MFHLFCMRDSWDPGEGMNHVTLQGNEKSYSVMKMVFDAVLRNTLAVSVSRDGKDPAYI